METKNVTMVDGTVVEANTFDYVVQVWEGGKWNTVAVKSDYVAAQSALNKYYSKGYRYTRIEQLF